MKTRQVDVKIDPFALRRDFELFIAPDILEIRADENLRDVPVPELEGVCQRIWIGFQIERFVRADEQKIEIVLGPPRTNCRAVTRKWLPMRIPFGVDRMPTLPK